MRPFPLVIAMLACAPTVSTAETRKVVAGPEYGARSWHRFWFGDGYRDVWTTPVELPVLDLATEAGGLTPVRQVGGMQTPGLAMKGADGKSYTFRNLIKEPERLLPPEWRDTVPAAIFRDQMAAGHPSVAPIVSFLARSVGILYERSKLVVMPDDPRLGEFRKTFGNQVGTFDNYPLPGDDGMTEIVSSEDLYKKWLGGQPFQVDSRAFLKARLLDLAIGNWDRHRKQWRWARVEGKPLWQPLPEDPDQAFSRYTGKVLAYVRLLQPKMMEYGGDYPDRIEGLTFNNDDVNRWLLSDLEWPAYEQVARELQGQLTDAVIDEGMRQAPPEWYAVAGAEMAAALKLRRNQLPEYARNFYRHLADRVDVRASDQAEVAQLRHGDDGSLEVTIAPGPEAVPFFKRRFVRSETEEVRLYLAGGADRLTETGGKGRIKVRVMGGAGDDALDDSASGGSDLRDWQGQNTFRLGSGTSVSQKPWTNPAPLEDGPWIEPRNYGHWTAPIVLAWWEPDQDFIIGGGFTRTSWGFRKYPWAAMHSLSAVYSTGYSKFRVSYTGQKRLTARSVIARVDLLASGIEDLNYFGFGNETADIEDKQLRQTQEYTLSAFPSLRFEPSKRTELYAGVEFRGQKPVGDQQTLVELEAPYGSGDFGEIVLRTGFDFDTRGRAANLAALLAFDLSQAEETKVSGVRLQGEAMYGPKAWDVTSDFGGVEGAVSGYLGNRKVSLALRAGGRTMFGNYPWFESAVIGGSSNVRGYDTNRFRGDSSLYGNAEVRVWAGRQRTPVLPLRIGLLGFVETGRVWLEGEDSDTWHPSYGGGVMLQPIGIPLTISSSLAWGDEGMHFYFKGGYSF